LLAVTGAQQKLGAVLDKGRFWERFAREPLNTRQILVMALSFKFPIRAISRWTRR
jgi:hypothetical protein